VQIVRRWAGWIYSQPYRAHSGRLKSFWSRRLVLDSDLMSLRKHYRESKTGKDWTERWRMDMAYSEDLDQLDKFEIHRYDLGNAEVIETCAVDLPQDDRGDESATTELQWPEESKAIWSSIGAILRAKGVTIRHAYLLSGREDMFAKTESW
jgi:hypothetical protein